jgi:hypothetical protein
MATTVAWRFPTQSLRRAETHAGGVLKDTLATTVSKIGICSTNSSKNPQYQISRKPVVFLEMLHA